MKRVAVINVVGLTSRLLGPNTPNLSRFRARSALATVRPIFPAVTCTAQSTYLTGRPPGEHGVVGNGWYDRTLAEVQFWKQSNHIVRGPKLWETLRESVPDFTCAKLFWWYNMYSSADFSITPRPMYPADGRKIFDIYTRPAGIRWDIKKDLGEFPFPFFWGPAAGIRSSEWIASSARWIEERHRPSLNLIYLPHLDYDFQRFGPADARCEAALREIDRVVGELIDFFEGRGVEVVILSEYGITEVDQPIHLNRIFRERGWIAIREELGRELLDCGASRAFAVADHQVAHVYLNDVSLESEVRQVLEQTPGVETVLDRDGKAAWGLAHERAGDLVAIADARSWFTYYYWDDDARAPDFARCVDIHRKPGYDPVELFIDPAIRFPKLRIAAFLAKKRLGFRALMEVIPLDASLVRGSHGRIPEDSRDFPVLMMAREELPSELPAVDVHGWLKRLCLN